MASVIGKIESLDGKFYIKEKDGSLREVQRGDEIHEGEIIVGADGNSPTNSAVVLLDDGTSIIISGNEKQLFDSSLVKEAFEESETVTDEKSIESAFDDSNSLLNEENDDTDTDTDEIETAAGEEHLNSGEFLESSFAKFNLEDSNVHADVKETDIVVQNPNELMQTSDDIVDEAYLSYLEDSITQTQSAIVEANSAAQVAQESANVVISEPTVVNLEEAETAQQNAKDAAQSATNAADRLEDTLNQLDGEVKQIGNINVSDVKDVISNARDAAQHAINVAQNSEERTDSLISDEFNEVQEAAQISDTELQEAQNNVPVESLETQSHNIEELLASTQNAKEFVSQDPESLRNIASLKETLLDTTAEYLQNAQANVQTAQINLTEAQEAVSATEIAITSATKAIENAQAANEDSSALESILADAQKSLVEANTILVDAQADYNSAQIELETAQTFSNQAQILNGEINNVIDEVISQQLQNVATLTEAATTAAQAANDAATAADEAAQTADEQPTPQNLAAAEQAQDAATTAATEATNAANTLQGAITQTQDAADAANESVDLTQATQVVAQTQDAAASANEAATQSELTTDAEIATMVQNVATLTEAAEQAAEAANDAAEQANEAAAKADEQPTPQNLAAAEQAQDAATTAATEATNAANTLQGAITQTQDAADAANESVDLTQATQVVAQTQDAAASANEAATIEIHTNSAPEAHDDMGSAITEGTILVNENFDHNVNGWNNGENQHNALNVEGDSIRDNDTTITSKTFDFGEENAGKTVNISFDLHGYQDNYENQHDGGWESHGRYQDDFNIYVNGNEISSDSFGNGHDDINHHYSFDAQLDSHGHLDLGLAFETSSTTREFADVDNLVIKAGSDWENSSLNIDEDHSLMIDVLANDTDADGDHLQITQINGENISDGGSVVIYGNNHEALGSVTLNEGKVLFTPDESLQSLNDGENQEVKFSYTVTDSHGATSSANVAVDVVGSNDEGVSLRYHDISHDTVETGNLDDTINIHHDITDSNVEMNDGNDELHLDDIQRGSHVDMGSGNDTITMDDIRSHSRVEMGSGDDVISGIGRDSQIKDATVNMGDGNDDLTTHTIRGDATVDMGSGNDSVHAKTIGDDAKLFMGEGDDSVSIDRVEADATIDTGAGNDDVTLKDISGRFDDGKVDLGSGDDSLTLHDNLHGVDAQFDLGEGEDSVTFEDSGSSSSSFGFEMGHMPFGGGAHHGFGFHGMDLHDGMEIDLSETNLKNVEEINLGHGSQDISLNIDDVLEVTDDDNILRINGDHLDTLSLDDNNGETEWKLGDFKTDEETGATYQEVIGVEDDTTVTLEVNTDIQIDQS